MDVVRAAAVNPVTTFSLNEEEEEEALTWSLALDLLPAIARDGFTGSGLNRAWEASIFLWVAPVKGRAIETAEVEAIVGLFFLLFV
ncbi:hypothetical protein GQ457_16G002530 [Hibiscus cannabinus]